MAKTTNENFKVFWTNHGYFSQEEFATIEDAMKYGKSKGFEFSVRQGNDIHCSWETFGGYRTYTDVARKAVSSPRSRV